MVSPGRDRRLMDRVLSPVCVAGTADTRSATKALTVDTARGALHEGDQIVRFDRTEDGHPAP